MKILITGLTGFIGKNFYRHTKYRENIFAVSTKSSINKNFHSRNINYLDCNLENIDNEDIEPLLNSFEIDLIRRARNKTKRFPKSSDPAVYSKATGFEALIGFLFLKDPQRLSKIFEYLECK